MEGVAVGASKRETGATDGEAGLDGIGEDDAETGADATVATVLAEMTEASPEASAPVDVLLACPVASAIFAVCSDVAVGDASVTICADGLDS